MRREDEDALINSKGFKKGCTQTLSCWFVFSTRQKRNFNPMVNFAATMSLFTYRFTGSGLRLRNHVPSPNDRFNGALLNGRWFFESIGINTLQKIRF